ncbi:alpha/beta hydrolase [Candidatus Gottesmanbacteria bacterium]|nr:alpha/beta hydrolase [Candidatus Gottesmanbacteria bacterium]
MKTIISKDGTKIAYEVSGQGPAVVLVDGALCYHDSGPGREIAKLLEPYFTTYIYDRRGRGESEDTKPYDIKREIEDLEAVIDAAGGKAFVFGQSSGAILSLEAARVIGAKIKKLAVYEAPMIVDDSRTPMGEEYRKRMEQLIAEDRRSDAVLMFFKSVQLPGVFSFLIRLTPLWSKLKSIANTLPYDFAIASPYQYGKPLSKDRWNKVTMPTWVGDGDKSPTWMRNSQKALVEVLPNAKYYTLPGQTHAVKAKSVVPELVKFFKA